MRADLLAGRNLYSIVSGPVPVVTYGSTMQLPPAGFVRSAQAWTGTFEPAPGVTEDEAVSFVQAVYKERDSQPPRRFGT